MAPGLDRHQPRTNGVFMAFIALYLRISQHALSFRAERGGFYLHLGLRTGACHDLGQRRRHLRSYHMRIFLSSSTTLFYSYQADALSIRIRIAILYLTTLPILFIQILILILQSTNQETLPSPLRALSQHIPILHLTGI